MKEPLQPSQAEFEMGPQTPEYLRPIWNDIRTQYEYIGFLGEGKTGAAHALKIIGTDTLVCLKTISEKILDRSIRKQAQETLKKEVGILRPLRHLSLPQLFKHDTDVDPPYYICTYHPGKTLKQFWDSKRRLSVEQTYYLIIALVNVLEYLHENGRTHCDLHQHNLLLSDNIINDGILLIDFGSGHRETETDPQTKDRGNKLFKGSAAEKKHNQIVQRRDKFNDFKLYDFNALGQLLQSSRDSLLEGSLANQIERFDELCDRLCNSEFASWTEVRERTQWIIDPDRLLTKVKKIFTSSDGLVRRIPLPVYRSIPVGDAILAVINSPCFQRLRGIQQLSFCDWIYPGATHSRFEHSLGVFNSTRKAILALLQQNEFSDRFSIDEIKGCLLAGLLHDIGHYPFAHVIEQYAAGRFSDDQNLRNEIHHGTISKEIITSDSHLKNAIHKYWGERSLNCCIEILNRQHGILSDLIDGPIDCDKIDYLKRDSVHSGLEYGSGLDLEQFFRQLVPLQDFAELGIKSDGVSSVEGFMILQDQMLNNVYWHRKIRSIICMFHAGLAFIVKKDAEALRNLVNDLKSTGNNYEAVGVILKHAAKAKREERGFLDTLMGLHHGKQGYGSIFAEVATYRHTDRKKRDHSQTMHNFILSQGSLSVTRSLPPIEWDNVSRLRKAVAHEIEKEGIQCSKADVIVDVPVGKSSHKQVHVLTGDGSVVPIRDVSFLNDVIFATPTAFASPIRIFVNPKVHDQIGTKWSRIVAAAEETLLAHHIEGDATEGF